MLADTAESARLLLDNFLNEIHKGDAPIFLLRPDISALESGRAIMQLPKEQQVAVVLEGMTRQVQFIRARQFHHESMVLSALFSSLLRKNLPFTGDDLEQLIRSMAGVDHAGWWTVVAPAAVLRTVESYVKAHDMAESLRAALEELA